MTHTTTEVEDDVVGDLGEPANYKAVMLDPDKEIWQGAMDEEMNPRKVNVYTRYKVSSGSSKAAHKLWNLTTRKKFFSCSRTLELLGILISYSSVLEYDDWQMDVKLSFLNGTSKSQVYGLKQCNHSQWNKQLMNKSRSLDHSFQNRDEPCVIAKLLAVLYSILDLIWMNILIMEGNYMQDLRKLRIILENVFSMKELGEAAYFWELKSIEIDQGV
ncbi:hypothetical protein Tco_0110767 [Tanacetum coccineum]